MHEIHAAKQHSASRIAPWPSGARLVIRPPFWGCPIYHVMNPTRGNYEAGSSRAPLFALLSRVCAVGGYRWIRPDLWVFGRPRLSGWSESTRSTPVVEPPLR